MLPVLLYCEERLEEPLRLAELAAIAGYSPHHFHRVFCTVVGEAPKAYLRRLRLERAVYRLKVSLDSVLRVALESGFATHETFTRAFVRRFDVSPSEFRSLLRSYRAHAEAAMGSRTFDGFTQETPLTLRFDLNKTVVTVQRTPARHLLFRRYYGYERLLDGRKDFLGLWDELLAYADSREISYVPETLIGITHDDPYVTEEDRIRFDACLSIAGPVEVEYPLGYRYLPSDLCVVRRHTGGLEEIAQTFAQIGVAWLPAGGYELRAAPPFEMYHCTRTSAGALERQATDACVPLVPSHITEV